MSTLVGHCFIGREMLPMTILGHPLRAGLPGSGWCSTNTVYVFIYRHPFHEKSIGAVGKIVQKGVAVNLCMYGTIWRKMSPSTSFE